MRRTEHDDAGRRVRIWVDEVEQTPRPYSPAENAEADAAAAVARREMNRSILLDRAQAAVADNLASLDKAQAIEGRTTFSNAQRDDALRFLAGEAVDRIKQTNAIIKLLLRDERPNLLDTTE